MNLLAMWKGKSAPYSLHSARSVGVTTDTLRTQGFCDVPLFPYIPSPHFLFRYLYHAPCFDPVVDFFRAFVRCDFCGSRSAKHFSMALLRCCCVPFPFICSSSAERLPAQFARRRCPCFASLLSLRMSCSITSLFVRPPPSLVFAQRCMSLHRLVRLLCTS